MTRDFKKLEMWCDARTLVLLIYRLTKTFPPGVRSLERNEPLPTANYPKPNTGDIID